MMPVREAQPADAAAMARVRVDTWRAAYRGLVPDSVLDALSYADSERLLRRILWEGSRNTAAFVAESPDGQVVGIAVGGPLFTAQTAGFRGEIYILYVLPAFQGQGLGRDLMQALARRMEQLSLTPLMLWTYAQNPAAKFYEKLGGAVVGEKEVDEGGKLLMTVAFGWSDVERLWK